MTRVPAATLLSGTAAWLEGLASALEHREADQLREDPDWNGVRITGRELPKLLDEMRAAAVNLRGIANDLGGAP